MIPVELQVIGAALRAVAEEMAAALVRAAFSPNIKERRDSSTALFDARGAMVTQAESIPVHLGAMPEAVAAVMGHAPGPDDVFILNDPYAGGTHLPDVTLVSRTELGFAVTRAHHADVGGVEPGSLLNRLRRHARARGSADVRRREPALALHRQKAEPPARRELAIGGVGKRRRQPGLERLRAVHRGRSG